MYVYLYAQYTHICIYYVYVYIHKYIIHYTERMVKQMRQNVNSWRIWISCTWELTALL